MLLGSNLSLFRLFVDVFKIGVVSATLGWFDFFTTSGRLAGEVITLIKSWPGKAIGSLDVPVY